MNKRLAFEQIFHPARASLRQLLNRQLQRFGFELVRRGECNVLDFLLDQLLRGSAEPLTLVQVGGNDGRLNDPLYEFVRAHHDRIRGYVLEPVSRYFEALTRTYRRYPGITALNLAIHQTRSAMPIYWVDEAKARRSPGYVQGIASFDPEHSRRHGIPEEAVVTEVVSCVSLQDLLERYSITRLDLLQIDTEGYDAEIVGSIDFDQIKPGIIRFEHCRLKLMDTEVFLGLLERLHAHSYELMIEARDVTAYQPEIVLPRLRAEQAPIAMEHQQSTAKVPPTAAQPVSPASPRSL